MSARAPLFFLHIPKTAGTSLRAWLLDQYGEQASFPKTDYRAVDAQDLAHLESYELIMGHFDARMLAYLEGGRHVTALMLREPVSRTVSALRHAIADPGFRPSGVAMEGRTLHQVIRDPDVMSRFANNQTGLLSARAQGSAGALALPFTFDAIEADLGLALATLERFDVVGLMEDVEACMLALAWRCGLYPVKAAPRLNVGRDLSDELLTAADRQIVASYNVLDLALYAAARMRPVPPTPDRTAVIAALPDACFPPLDGADILLRTPFCGYGLYRPDDIARTRPGRWTGRGNLAGVTFRLPAARQCAFYVDYFFVDGYASSVAFLLDGEEVAAQVCTIRGACFAKIVYAPPGAGAREVTLELRTDRVAATAQDVRPRGLVVTGLRAIRLA